MLRNEPQELSYKIASPMYVKFEGLKQNEQNLEST